MDQECFQKQLKRPRKANKISLSSTHKRSSGNTTTIASLPYYVLLDVIAQVASKSLTDLVNVKLCCKDLLKAAEDNYIFQHVSMEKFPVIPWCLSKEVSLFINSCKENGNAEALYRQGLVEFFSTKNKQEFGLVNLRRAVRKGHIEATYVYGIILLCEGGGESRKQEGLKLLSSCFKYKNKLMIKQCRERIRKTLRYMWVNNRIVHEQNSTKTCSFNKGMNIEEGFLVQRRQGWSNEEENNITCCESCLWEYEAHLFCNLLPNY